MKSVVVVRDQTNTEAGIMEWAQRIGGPGWALIESYTKLTLQEWVPGQSLPLVLGDEFAGRIFGEKAEVRWVRDRDGINVWVVEEADASGVPMEYIDRYYYGLGYWLQGKGKFWEPTLPDRQNSIYRASLGSNARDQDRVRFTVREYSSPAPAMWPSDADGLEQLANEPLLVDYRLMSLDCGTGEKE